MKHLLRLVPVLGALMLSGIARGDGLRTSLRLLAFHPGLSAPEVFLHDPSAAEETAAVKAEIKSYLNHEAFPLVLTGSKLVITTSPDRASITRDADRVGEATLPDGARSAILLFLPAAPDAKSKAQILPIEDSKKAFPAGSFRVSNLSPRPVRIMLEKENFDFKPGQTLLIEDPPVRENQHSGMKAFAFTDNEWRRIGSGLWPHPGTSRTLQILFHNPASGQVQMRAFDDVPPRDPEPEPAAIP